MATLAKAQTAEAAAVNMRSLLIVVLLCSSLALTSKLGVFSLVEALTTDILRPEVADGSLATAGRNVAVIVIDAIA